MQSFQADNEVLGTRIEGQRTGEGHTASIPPQTTNDSATSSTESISDESFPRLLGTAIGELIKEKEHRRAIIKEKFICLYRNKKNQKPSSEEKKNKKQESSSSGEHQKEKEKSLKCDECDIEHCCLACYEQHRFSAPTKHELKRFVAFIERSVRKFELCDEARRPMLLEMVQEVIDRFNATRHFHFEVPNSDFMLRFSVFSKLFKDILTANPQMSLQDLMFVRTFNFGTLLNGFSNRERIIVGANFSASLLEELYLVEVCRQNNSGFLVGVELNPGPPYASLASYLLITLSGNVGFSADAFSFYRMIISLISLPLLIMIVLYPGKITLTSLLIRQVSLFYISITPLLHYFAYRYYLQEVDRVNNQGFLVGIEPNPGPNVDEDAFLMAFLKNQAKVESARKNPPTPSTLGGGRDARRQKTLEMRKVKKKLQHKHAHADKMTRASMFPEAGLNLKINELSMSNDTMSFLSSFVDNLKGIISSYKPAVKIEIDWTSCVVTNLKLVFDWAKKHLVWFFDVLKFCLNLLMSVLEDSWKQAFTIFSEFFCMNPEAGLLDVGIATSLYASTIGKHLKHGDVFGILKMLKHLGSTVETLSDLRQGVWKVIATLVLQINRWFGTSFHVATGFPKIDALWERFRLVVKRLDSDEHDRYEIALALYALFTDVEDAYRESDDKDEKDQLRFLVNTMRPKRVDCEATINPNNGPRCEGLGVCVAGPTGSGKSTFTFPTLLALMSMVISTYYPEKLESFMANHNGIIFYRHVINEFWDGLTRSHMVIVYDEFAQLKDKPGAPSNDAAEILALLNTAPMHLHYSSIADKAKHYANPKVVWCTTNRQKFEFESIVESKAVVRRFHVAVVQVPKLEYCVDPHVMNVFDRRLDLSKVRALHPFIDQDPDTWYVSDVQEYISWDFNTGLPKVGDDSYTKNFDEFVQHLWEKYKLVATKGQQVLDFHKHMKSKYVRKMEVQMDNVSDFESEDCSFTTAPVHEAPVSGPFKPALLPVHCVDDSSDDEDLLPQESRTVYLKGIAALSNRLDEYRLLYPSVENYIPNVETRTMMLKTFGALSAIFGVVKLFRWFTRPSEESGVPVRSNRRGQRKADVRTAVEDGIRKFLPESGAHDVVTKILLRNMYRVYANGNLLGFALMIKGRLGLMPMHFLDVTDDELIFEFVNYYGGATAVKVNADNLNYVDFHNSYSETTVRPDIILFSLPDTCRMHANVVNMFLPRSKFVKGNKFESVMPVLRSAQNDPKKQNADVLLLNPTVRVATSIEYRTYASAGIGYYADTAPADCGSLLITDDKRLGGPKILGFHTAGSAGFYGATQDFFGTKSGCGVAFYKDEIVRAIARLEDEDEDLDFTEELDFCVEPEDGFRQIGRTQAPNLPTRSKIVPSPLHGSLWDITTAKAKLRPFEKDGFTIDPRQIAHEKYNNPNICNALTEVKRAQGIVGALVLAKNKPEPFLPKVYDFDEAVSGIDGVEFADAINRQTSAGYPFVLGKTKDKSYWLGKEGKPDSSSQGYKELKNMVDEVIEKAKKGIRCTHFYMDCLKDERLSLEKVAVGKTRQFMACPVVYTVAIKQYFGDFARHVCHNRIDNGIAIGVDPHKEWDHLYTHLHPLSTYVHGAGDYKGFDTKLPTAVMWSFLAIVEDFYAPTSSKEDTRVRLILFQDMVNSIHVTSDGKVYEFYGKNPSGNPLTSILNSVCNAIMLVAAWLKNGISACDIIEKFRWITGGDDHCTGFPGEFVDLAGSVAMAKALKDMFDYVYTDEAKGLDLVPCKTMDEITFYKRSFKYVHHRMRAPLDISVLKETLNWQKRTCSKDEFELRVQCFLIELSQHGKRIFDEHAPKVLKQCAEREIHVKFCTWASVIDRVQEVKFYH
ncbi:MAG: polymerase protein [Apis dicistrovirus 4]|nr:MAG: polymerase protein [Apis dicistrovirus 4]